MSSVLIAGSTGLVGNEVLTQLLSDDYFTKVKILLRRDVNFTHKKLEKIIIDFDKISENDNLDADIIISTLGTTIKKAGTKENFKKVDYDYPLEIAKRALNKGAEHFILVSAIGADRNSNIFYNKVKGELEEAISQLPYKKITIVRPSLLLGERNEKRLGEDLAKFFNFLIPKKYKGIKVEKVAKSILYSAKKEFNGIIIYESQQMNEMFS